VVTLGILTLVDNLTDIDKDFGRKTFESGRHPELRGLQSYSYDEVVEMDLQGDACVAKNRAEGGSMVKQERVWRLCKVEVRGCGLLLERC
jgi:hypothetical protein